MSTPAAGGEPAPPDLTGKDWAIALAVLAVIIALLAWGASAAWRALFGDDEPEYVDESPSRIEQQYEDVPAGPVNPGTGKYTVEECLAFRADMLDDSKSEWERSDSVGKYTVHCEGRS